MTDETIEKLEKSRDDRGFWLAATAITLLSVVGLYLCVYEWQTDDPLIKEIRAALISAFATTAFFSVLFSVLSRTDYVGSLRRALTVVLGGDAHLFEKFSPQVRQAFVSNSLSATLGSEIGGAVFSDLVQPLTAATAGYRRKYKYDVAFLDSLPKIAIKDGSSERLRAIHDKIVGREKEYVWVREYFQYERFVPSQGGTYKGGYNICFAINREAPQLFLGEDVIFFREVIELDDEARGLLVSLTEGELHDFVADVLQLKVVEFATRTPVRFHVRLFQSEEFGAVISVVTEAFAKVEGAEGLAISFVVPQFRAAPWFVVSMPQPTHNAEITFRRSPTMHRMVPVRFLPNINPQRISQRWIDGSDTEPDGVEFRVSGWSFPTSGVIFTWRYPENSTTS
jgi:hypothetical protein